MCRACYIEEYPGVCVERESALAYSFSDEILKLKLWTMHLVVVSG